MSNLKDKFVYTFGDGKAEGQANMKNLLGGKGANLAEMNRIGIPVPPGFTITTEACTLFNREGQAKLTSLIREQVEAGVRNMEDIMEMKFGDPDNPLLLSVRSGARVSMPGMMDTVLNLGLNDEIVEGMAIRWKDERFAWDSYRRLVQMYGDVVMGLKPESKEDTDPFEYIIEQMKEERGVKLDTDLSAEDLKTLVQQFKDAILEKTGEPFPTDPWDQLWGSIFAVFSSWSNDRAQVYRNLNDIPNDWGTAVNVQAMVYGNLGRGSATGVAFTRDAATGEDIFNGEFLMNAQGEDVVAGIRTPQQITLEGSRRWAKLAKVSEAERKENYASLEELLPEAFKKLDVAQQKLEDHYRDMQDLEFTIQEGKLWLLQTRTGKRTGMSMVKIAMDFLREGQIDERTALLRMDPKRLDELLHPIFADDARDDAELLVKGLPASPGAASGRIVFFADDAEEWAEQGEKVILVRVETSPEDLRGMNAAQGILTARGGMTSHAAVVARGMGKCCVSGAGGLRINYRERTVEADGKKLKEGDWISLNGTTGKVFIGQLPTREPELSGDFAELMEMSSRYATMEVRTNADTPDEAAVAHRFGATGIGLCRTEHMFFEDDRILAMREMILAEDEAGRRKALAKLLPMQREDFEGLMEEMHDLPVTIRLLDPPLHEFVPQDESSQREMAKQMGVSLEVIQEKVESLKEVNPMLGHRGVRLGITYTEITEMQTRAILEAALNLKRRGVHAKPEIMIPLVECVQEFQQQAEVVRRTAAEVFNKYNDEIEYHVGTMIEVPRAALVADRIAEEADFFSFGTNDLTQLTYGFSRDDVGKFLPLYLRKGILDHDPFAQLDAQGVGQLVRIGVEKGRSVKPTLSVGVCGEHGGDPASIDFVNTLGLNYVSCSPFRVPIARLSAAQAALRQEVLEPA